MVNFQKYPKAFIEMLNNHCYNNADSLLTYSNVYFNDTKWDELPHSSKMRYFYWLIEQGKKNNRPVSGEEAKQKLKDHYFKNYEMYNAITKSTFKNISV